MKKLLVCFLTLCMVLTMIATLSVTASAADPLATVTVGTQIFTYDTFEAAVKKAQENEGSTLRLLRYTPDIDGLEIGGTYTLDLGGAYLHVKNPLIISTGTVTITNSAGADDQGFIMTSKNTALNSKPWHRQDLSVGHSAHQGRHLRRLCRHCSRQQRRC